MFFVYNYVDVGKYECFDIKRNYIFEVVMNYFLEGIGLGW